MKSTAAALIGLCPSVAAGQDAGDPAEQQVERQQTQPLNNAPVWREVRSGVPAETAVIGRETNVLIQPAMKLPGLPAVSAGEALRPARPPLSTPAGGPHTRPRPAPPGVFRPPPPPPLPPHPP